MAIAEYVANWPDNDKANDHPMLRRARRFRTFWETHPDDEKEVHKHWQALEKNSIWHEDKSRGVIASQRDSLVTTFLIWPDVPSRQPHTALYSERKLGLITLTVEQERSYYGGVANDVRSVLLFLHPNRGGFEHLLEDANATGGEALIECSALRSVDGNLTAALRRLERVLSLVDPGAKYPTGQPDSSHAAHSSYIALLAALNQKLIKPQCSAIAYLANVNNRDHQVTAAAIRMAWKRNTNTKL